MIRRLVTAPSGLGCAGVDGPLRGHLLEEWSGDLLPAFATPLARRPAGQEAVVPDTVGRDARPQAIGQLTDLEIGYSGNPAVRGQGYAAEAVRALVAHLHILPGVRPLTADTALTSRASERGLEQIGGPHAASAGRPRTAM